MKQVIFIINSLQSGGAERVVATQANNLNRAGYGVTILFLRQRVQYELDPEIQLVFLTDKESFKLRDYTLNLVKLTVQIGRKIDEIEKQGEIVLITSHLLFPHLVTRLSRYDKKTIYVQHCVQGIVPYAQKLWYKWLLHWLYGGRQIVCVSDDLCKELREVYGVRTPAMQTIYNPINFADLDCKMAEPLVYSRPFFLFCGRLTPQKRPERVIETFYQGKFFEHYDLVILGEGELRESLERLVSKYGLEKRVVFMGWESNVYKWMHAASLLLLTSDWEGLGMVLIEALYCGCPVVSVRCPGPPEILTGPLEKYLCKSDIKSIVRTVREAIRFYPDNLRRFTLKFDVEKNIQNYLEVYKKWNPK